MAVFLDESANIIAIGGLTQDTVNGDYDISANNEITSNVYLYNYTIPVVDGKTGAISLSGKIEATDGKTALMGLDQNTPTQLSVLVYLDGDVVDNSMVAAEEVASLVGSLNLQFASSADLVPMDYTDLKENNGAASSETATEAATEAPAGN